MYKNESISYMHIIKDPLRIGCDVVTGVNHRVCGSDRDTANVVTKVMTRKNSLRIAEKANFRILLSYK